MAVLTITDDIRYVEKKWFSRDFQKIGEPCGCGYSFPCEEDGEPFLTNPGQEENYRYCLSHPDTFEDLGVVKHEQTYKEPAKGVCSCGEIVELRSQYMGAFECPRCGQWYNIFGQALLPPEQWGDGGIY